MTTYKSLVGQKILKVSTDPSNPLEGQVWYNTTTGMLKAIPLLEAFSSAANLTNGRDERAAGAGTQTAGISFGGVIPPASDAPNSIVTTEEYNGSGWSAGGNIPQGGWNMAGCGPLTAALGFGGVYPGGVLNNTNEYNGTSWTAGGNLNTAGRMGAGFGTQTAAAAAGRGTPSASAIVEEYNGSSWSEVNDLPAAAYMQASAGSQTAATIGGSNQSPKQQVLGYDGTNWTTLTSLNEERNSTSYAGDQNDFLIMGGNNNLTSTTLWNGTTHTANAAMSNGRGPTGSATNAIQPSASGSIVSGGYNGSSTISAAEEYNRSSNKVTGAAWVSGANMNTGRGTGGDCGTYLAGLVFGGNPYSAPYTSDTTEEYDGTAWSESGDLASATSDASGAGTQTAALCFARSSSPTSLTQTYDGSTWTSVPATLPSISQSRGIGTQTAALVCGNGTESYEYDGSSWTASGDLNNNRSAQKPGGWGLQTAAVLGGGYFSPPATILSNTETYNGTSWTETGHSVLSAVKRTAVSTAAPSSNGLMFSGPTGAGSNTSTTITQGYDGTAWFTQPSLATARTNAQGFGTAANAVAAGGHGFPGGQLNATEEFTGETTALNVELITTS